MQGDNVRYCEASRFGKVCMNIQQQGIQVDFAIYSES